MKTDVHVRPASMADAEALYRARISPAAAAGTMAVPSMSPEQFSAQLKGLVEDHRHHTFAAELEGRVVGMGNLTVGRGRRSHVGSIGMYVADDACGRGVGTAIMKALVDIVDNWLLLKRLELEVYPDNEVAIRLYEKFGFCREGVKRSAAVKDGRLVDIIMMGRVRDTGTIASGDRPSL